MTDADEVTAEAPETPPAPVATAENGSVLVYADSGVLGLTAGRRYLLPTAQEVLDAIEAKLLTVLDVGEVRVIDEDVETPPADLVVDDAPPPAKKATAKRTTARKRAR